MDNIASMYLVTYYADPNKSVITQRIVKARDDDEAYSNVMTIDDQHYGFLRAQLITSKDGINSNELE